MTLATLLLIALSLSFDAFGASAGRGAVSPSLGSLREVRVAALFGAFAVAAPLAGWALGRAFYSVLQFYDHWVAFVLLGAVGAKMIRDGVVGASTAHDPAGYRLLVLVASALATSIDAGVVGLGLPLMHVNAVLAAGVIGAVTFAASLAGLRLGAASGRAFGPRAEIAGGVLLIAIGTKILIAHLFF